MKDFVILKTNDNIRPYVCFMNTVEDVYYYLDDIKKDVSKLGVKKILIDLFLSNGYSFNRFFELQISGNEDKTLLINPRDVNDYVNQTINDYLYKNKHLLENSALSQSLIQIVIKELKN